ncbi:MAG: serine hydrolase domain-containing protein [Solirubrobacteraceae bacterium]
MSSTVSERIHAAAEPYVGPDGVPGLVALVIGGDDQTVVTLGNLDVEPGRPVQRDSLFRVTSTTKPITAAATLTQRMFESPATPQLHLDIQAAVRA